MSKILIGLREQGMNITLNNKMMRMLDCEFIGLNAKNILAAAEAKKPELIVLYVSKISADEETELTKFLANSGVLPIVLAGDRPLLSRFLGKTNANIVRYIKTPILLSAYVKEIQKVLERVEGVLSAEETEIMEPEEIEEIAPAKHILVVDDDVVMLRTINNWLSDIFNVSVVKSGAAALQFLAKTKPDLILLDYNMPVCDGVQTLQMIRAEPNLKDIPVFFLTGVDDHEQIKRALELRPQGYILKSNGAEYLVSKIEAYL